MEKDLKRLIKQKRLQIKKKYNRLLPIQDLLSDRWETAKFYNFGKGTSCYNNVIILGNVKVGKNTWIGPNVILDGSGGLEIGDNCSISAGVHIYSHNSVQNVISGGKIKIIKKKTIISNRVYIGPNSIITMGVEIGDGAVIGALSFVDKNIKKKKKFINGVVK